MLFTSCPRLLESCVEKMNDKNTHNNYLGSTVDEVEDISSRSWLCNLPLVTRKPPEGYIFLRPASSTARST
jgi:hypothetical protein